MATGLTSLVGNMNGQTSDGGVGRGWPGLRLVIPEKGNRYLVWGQGDFAAVLNEKGIALTGFMRISKEFPPYSGTSKYLSPGDLLRLSDSAAEYMTLWSENATECGSPVNLATLVVDPKEGYLLEATNFAYGDPANHAIHGPMTDQVFASANFFISERLKGFAEAGIGAGYTRAQTLWGLLVDRQYDSITLQPSPPAPGSGISLAYFMSCFRDHGNIPPEEGRMSCFVPEERGEGAICIHGIGETTAFAWIGVARADHTDLFSCLWMTPNQPCISPFLPFYIGINKVPEGLDTTGAFDLFKELRLAVEYRPEYWDEITQYWTVFEIQAIEESYGVESEAGRLADEGDVGRARELLSEFVEKKCDEAMAAVQNILDFLNNLPLLGGGEASPPWGP
jgi:hypothetical protein